MDKELKVILCILFVLLGFFVVMWLRFAVFIVSPDNSFAKQDILISPLYLGYLITFASAPIAYLLGMDKSTKNKYRIWGIAIMLPISLPLSYSLGITYSFIVRSPWGTLLMLYIFPLVFIVGVILLLVGIFKKEEIK
ncbi:hypothetical protein SPD48_04765 [Pseudogracilibacillus sp. SE30717A]|uniref:hypothetical protein n=1 Tax=Pseudogracilibacillus sp. SE30717A TaxID=3098293 RepID=UPI00300E6333